jgi:hypothetical protein
MITAAGPKTGMILQMEKNLYKVLATEYHMGGGKMDMRLAVEFLDGEPVNVLFPEWVEVASKRYVEPAKR